MVSRPDEGARHVVGALALQGDFAQHVRTFRSLGAEAREVRTADDLADLAGLVIPGGESTTMTKLLTPDLRAALEAFCRAHPVWGTCAGMIMLSREAADPRVRPFGFLDVDIERNGYGRQVHSFEADLRAAPELGDPDRPLHGIFIRAPRLTRLGPDVVPLIWLDDEPVCVRQGHFLASAFHPELTGDTRLPRYFLSLLS
jgi:pyridoxal 5'-phosphate synthase pdxT subunit